MRRLILPGAGLAKVNDRLDSRKYSEFAGMLSLGLTLPTGLLLAYLANSVFGIKVGDSTLHFSWFWGPLPL